MPIGLRTLALAAAIAATSLFAALPAEARGAHGSHHAHAARPGHATHHATRHSAHRAMHHPRNRHRAAAAHRKRHAKAESGGSSMGPGCLPAILRTRLAQIAQKFGHIEVISANRPGATMPSGRTSYHASCRAVDFNPPRGKYEQVANWLKANHDGGVGTYSCGMHHIHIDNGPRVRFHHCQ